MKIGNALQMIATAARAAGALSAMAKRWPAVRPMAKDARQMVGHLRRVVDDPSAIEDVVREMYEFTDSLAMAVGVPARKVTGG